MLYAYDCVIIPDFGGLITHYAPAKIHPIKHTFTPPSKRIAFNEQLKVNDGLLISTLAQSQQWSMPQAQREVAGFVQELKEQLQTQHRFQLSDVGVFRYNTERKLVFESIEGENFLENSFGLPELVAKPILGKETLVLRGNYQDQLAQPVTGASKVKLRLQKMYRVGASLVIGGLSISAVYLWSLQADVNLSSLNPFTLLQNQTVEQPKAPQPVEADAFEQAQLTEQYSTQLQEDWSVEQELAREDSLLASFPKQSPKTETEVAPAETPVPVKAKVEVAKPAAEVAPAPVKVAPAVPAAKESKPTVEVHKKTGKFYVIMGVFSQEDYATMNQKRLAKKGYTSKIIPTYNNKRHRVSVAEFSSAAEAQAALPSLRGKISQELWVLNY